MVLKNNDVVLFQGDSVTDCGRAYEDINSLGGGYPMLIAAGFSALYPELDVRFINKGISGNRSKDLKARWDTDCLQLKPSFISILIGINDCWRRYDSNDPTSAEDFENNYRYLLTKIREKTDARVLLCEPFVLPVPEDRKVWREDLDPKIHIVRDLAREFKTMLLPLDGIFSSASALKPPAFWLPDGVHPSMAGHALISKEWFRITGCI